MDTPFVGHVVCRRGNRFVSAILLFGFVVLSLTEIASAKPSKPWDLASQKERNAYIVEIALQDVGKNFAKNCKNWANKIVEYVSRYGGSKKISLPATVNQWGQTDPDGWAWAPAPHIWTPQQSRRIGTALPGQIIQMNWKNKDGSVVVHTAIVGLVKGGRIWFLDSNWNDPAHPGERNWVQNHDLSLSDVEKAVGNKFTIYEIQ